MPIAAAPAGKDRPRAATRARAIKALQYFDIEGFSLIFQKEFMTYSCPNPSGQDREASLYDFLPGLTA
jgi:hypothetical protein